MTPPGKVGHCDKCGDWRLIIDGKGRCFKCAEPNQPEPTIVKASISAMPKTLLDPMPKVTVDLSNGESKCLFEYYPDEISFTAEEFIGLTEQQAHNLKFKKDKEWLQS